MNEEYLMNQINSDIKLNKLIEKIFDNWKIKEKSASHFFREISDYCLDINEGSIGADKASEIMRFGFSLTKCQKPLYMFKHSFYEEYYFAGSLDKIMNRIYLAYDDILNQNNEIQGSIYAIENKKNR